MTTIPNDIMAAAIRALMVPEHEMVESVSLSILAAEKRGEERERAKLNAIIDMWKRRDHLSLHSGEVTAQEFRTVVAVLNAIAAAIRKGSD